MQTVDLIATCAFGLEAIVKRELKQLGYDPRTLHPGRIQFSGDFQAICRANLFLRCAERILICLGRFEANDFGELFDQTNALPWHEWISKDGAFPVKGKSVKSQLSSVPACQRMVKKAIVNKLLAAHQLSTLPETGPSYAVEVALLDNVATLSIDTTGSGLHKRGYRPSTGPAPLRETLAAALVKLSFWKPDRPLIDPFCGTGTIPIEAAMIGRRIAPGLKRSFVSESWPMVSRDVWKAARDEAQDQILPKLEERILGTDASWRDLKLARNHAAAAGVEEDIHFQQIKFEDLTSKRKYGCTICNPPYGRRIGDRQEVLPLYQTFPLVLRRLPTWSHFVLTSLVDFERVVGQQADRRRKLYNGRIECQYYQFHGPDPTGPSTGHPTEMDQPKKPKSALQPVFGGVDQTAMRQATEFRNRLTKRARHLRRWPGRGITCYRLYERDVPEVPLVVDRYEDNLHIAEFARPHERTVAQHADWLDLMVKTAAEVTDVDLANVHMKYHDRQRGRSQYERSSSEGRTLVVNEGGLKFRVNLSDYLDTGLFLDHRQTRELVRNSAGNCRFLNLFGYTGSFTAYAIAGGANSSVTVDSSNTYLKWAEENLRLNNLMGPKQRFVRSDAIDYLQGLPGDSQFDLAVVDPPTFSNSKDHQRDWEVQRDHVSLLHAVKRRMSPQGVIFFSTNFRRFKLADTELAGLQIREITKQTIPPDFRNQRIHRCWKMTLVS